MIKDILERVFNEIKDDYLLSAEFLVNLKILLVQDAVNAKLLKLNDDALRCSDENRMKMYETLTNVYLEAIKLLFNTFNIESSESALMFFNKLNDNIQNDPRLNVFINEDMEYIEEFREYFNEIISFLNEYE